ncbi:hypothetical protein H4R34_000130 [Dimargaris verticillata]|uniref:HTH TFE/IIEalpha-type domain-containing protein n=1 Tax=Dimargaris verticillata TaxID=2761393 RepID=A0A9W8BE23_9FUNG|nr:hypothetical protein H4R34_000130 [Dimargaris verticillata]
MDVVKNLVSYVGRAFLEPRSVIALDYINMRESVRDDELAGFMKIPLRDVHKLGGLLKEGHLIKIATRMEPRKPDQRMIPKTYYYIDYKHFVDVIKWKMWKLQKNAGDQMQTEVDKKGYICPQCRTAYDALDILNFCDPATGLFYCERCRTELVENLQTESNVGAQETLSRLMDQFGPIINLLKKTDSIIIPATTFAPTAPLSDASADGDGHSNADRPDFELSYARDTGAGGNDIVIVFEDDKSSEEARREQEAAMDKKRQQNALPAWHTYSTVSGVRTDGRQQHPPELELHRRSISAPSMKDPIHSAGHENKIAEYYMHLESEPSTTGPDSTPNGTHSQTSDASTTPQSLTLTTGAMSQLDLNREVAYPSPQLSAVPTAVDSPMPTVAPLDAELQSASTRTANNSIEAAADGHLPHAIVNGIPMPLDQITEEHHALMTPEEYEKSAYPKDKPNASPVASPARMVPQTQNTTVMASALASPKTGPSPSPGQTISPGEQVGVDSRAFWATMDASKNEAVQKPVVDK